MCVHVCGHVHVCVCLCVFVCMYACQHPGLILNIIPHHFSTLFTEVGALHQTQDYPANLDSHLYFWESPVLVFWGWNYRQASHCTNPVFIRFSGNPNSSPYTWMPSALTTNPSPQPLDGFSDGYFSLLPYSHLHILSLPLPQPILLTLSPDFILQIWNSLWSSLCRSLSYL